MLSFLKTFRHSSRMKTVSYDSRKDSYLDPYIILLLSMIYVIFVAHTLISVECHIIHFPSMMKLLPACISFSYYVIKTWFNDIYKYLNPAFSTPLATSLLILC